MARLTLQDAESTARRGRPWSFRLEYVGSNLTNVSGQSDKYWYATGRGINEPVEIGWGANGRPPHGTTLADWTKLRKVVPEKLAKGYDYVDHPYVRMSAKSLAKIGGVTPSSPRTAPSTAPVPAAPLSTHPLGNPVAPAAPVTQPAPAQATKTSAQVSSDLLALGEPWSLIRSLKVIRDGTTVRGYSARDENDSELLKFDPSGGVDFARDYDVDIAWV